jgi:antitoxin PrlF
MQLHYPSGMAKVQGESSLTDRYQTTVPEPIRKALALGKRDKIHYEVNDSGQVVLSKVINDIDPAVLAFLSFLEKQIVEDPASVAPLNSEILARAKQLTSGIELDLSAPLNPADD